MSQALMLIAGLISGSVSAGQTPEEREVSIALTAAVKALNAKMPMALDEETRLDSVATTKNQLIYTNTMVNYTVEQLDIAQFDTIIEEAVIAPLCSNKQLELFITLNVEMIYRYLDLNGEYISEIGFDMGQCKPS